MATSPSLLYYTASVIHAISIPGHIAFGFETVHAAIDAVPPTPDLAVGKQGVRNAWDLANGMFAISALLNYQWALTGGPTTMAEQLMLLASVAASAYPGYGYFKLGAYAPLGCLWVAPWCSAAAFLLGAK